MHFELAEEHRMLKDLVQKFVRDEQMPLEADVMAREAEGKGLYLPDADHQRLDAKAQGSGRQTPLLRVKKDNPRDLERLEEQLADALTAQVEIRIHRRTKRGEQGEVAISFG